MNRFNFTTVGIAVLIVLQLATLSFIFFRHERRGGHSQANRHEGRYNNAPNHQMRGHGEMGRGNHFGGRMMQELQLTPEQKSKMEALRATQKSRSEMVMDKIKTLRNKEVELLQSGKLDDAQISSIASSYGEYQKELRTIRLNHWKEVSAMLTPEQKEKFGKLFSEHSGSRKDEREFHQ